MNIGEIARRSGVARSTVSYALSGKRPVSDETKRRIQEVIDELDYRPIVSARALKEGRTRTVGLVIPPAGDLDGSFERLIGGRRVDGVILMADPRVVRLAQTGIPFVAIGRVADPDQTWWVDVDYAAGVGRCVEHLSDLGHRTVALINPPAGLMAAGYGPGRSKSSSRRVLIASWSQRDSDKKNCGRCTAGCCAPTTGSAPASAARVLS